MALSLLSLTAPALLHLASPTLRLAPPVMNLGHDVSRSQAGLDYWYTGHLQIFMFQEVSQYQTCS